MPASQLRVRDPDLVPLEEAMRPLNTWTTVEKSTLFLSCNESFKTENTFMGFLFVCLTF